MFWKFDLKIYAKNFSNKILLESWNRFDSNFGSNSSMDYFWPEPLTLHLQFISIKRSSRSVQPFKYRKIFWKLDLRFYCMPLHISNLHFVFAIKLKSSVSFDDRAICCNGKTFQTVLFFYFLQYNILKRFFLLSFHDSTNQESCALRHFQIKGFPTTDKLSRSLSVSNLFTSIEILMALLQEVSISSRTVTRICWSRTKMPPAVRGQKGRHSYKEKECDKRKKYYNFKSYS